jgi:hypothetical protein
MLPHFQFPIIHGYSQIQFARLTHQSLARQNETRTVHTSIRNLCPSFPCLYSIAQNILYECFDHSCAGTRLHHRGYRRARSKRNIPRLMAFAQQPLWDDGELVVGPWLEPELLAEVLQELVDVLERPENWQPALQSSRVGGDVFVDVDRWSRPQRGDLAALKDAGCVSNDWKVRSRPLLTGTTLC